MPDNIAQEIADRITFRTLDLMRFDTTLRRSLRTILRRVETNLLLDLEDIDPSAVERLTYRERRLAALEAQTRRTIATGYRQAVSATRADMVAIGNLEAQMTRQIVAEAVGVDLLTVSVPSKVLKAISTNVLIKGAPVQDWFGRDGAAYHRRFVDEMREGVARGETIADLRRRLRGTRAGKFQDGIAQMPRHRADTLARSVVLGVANHVRDEVYKENRDVIRGVQALVTFDLKTSELCISRSGASWDPHTKRPLPESPRRERYPGPPPWHFNCRSTLIPVLKPWDQITGRRGAALARLSTGKRASMDGQVAADMTFDQWLRRREQRHPGSAREVLGVTKSKLWASGKLSLPKLTDQTGRPIRSRDLLQLAERRKKRT